MDNMHAKFPMTNALAALLLQPVIETWMLQSLKRSILMFAPQKLYRSNVDVIKKETDE